MDLSAKNRNAFVKLKSEVLVAGRKLTTLVRSRTVTPVHRVTRFTSVLAPSASLSNSLHLDSCSNQSLAATLRNNIENSSLDQS